MHAVMVLGYILTFLFLFKFILFKVMLVRSNLHFDEAILGIYAMLWLILCLWLLTEKKASITVKLLKRINLWFGEEWGTKFVYKISCVPLQFFFFNLVLFIGLQIDFTSFVFFKLYICSIPLFFFFL